MKNILTDIEAMPFYRIIGIIVTLIATKNVFMSVVDWSGMKGWEAYFIAQAVAEGNGYSFPSNTRWLFESVKDGMYHPTAWVDPFYTYILSGFIVLFGDYHKLAAAILNYALFILSFFFLYQIVRRLISSQAAMLAIILLAISNFSSLNSQMNNTFLATSLILLSILVLMNYFDQPGYRKAIVLGLVLGFTVLASPSAQLFIPVVALSIIYWRNDKLKIAVLHSIIVCVAFLLVIAPWAIRNYLVFDEFVLARSGAGQISFVGVVATAATVAPETITSKTKPAWKEKNSKTAVFNIKRNGDKRRSLEKFQMEYANELGPKHWGAMNEAKRDKWFFQEVKKYFIKNPLISIRLAIAKIELFIRSMGKFGIAMMLLALIGVMVTLKNRVASTISVLVASYIGPFMLIIIYYNRYRAPIEPLIILLAVFALYWIFCKLEFLRSVVTGRRNVCSFLK